MPELALAWRLADPHAHAVADGSTVALTFGDGGRLRLDLPSAAAADLLTRLADTHGLGEADLARLPDTGRALVTLERLRLAGRLEWCAETGSAKGDLDPFAIIQPLTHRFEPLEAATAGLDIDRFAYLRRDAGVAVLESPEAACRLLLSPAAGAAIARIMAGAPTETDAPAYQLLGRAGFLTARPEAPTRQIWSFQDRLFHAATRPAHEAVRVGPTERFKGVLPKPAPAWAEEPPAPPKPAPAESAPLHHLLEQRRSVRDFADRPPSRAQMEALFSRTLRITGRRRAGLESWVERPVPAAGGLGEIVGYLAVRAVDGLAPGLWRHDALADRLDLVAGPAPALDRMFETVAAFTQRPGTPPPAVVVLAARLPQLAWKYEAIAYRLALLDAGAALGILHLAALDVGLGACAVGTMNPRHFAMLAETDDFTEVSLVEMAVGRPV
ncbi:SagB family peptide dehydrogenase [Azospirillum sp. B4]|uniref:SagB family peptide dehydrogenase n=1 Tax=Azospirillum sp. B4 TaxID=95605 RepID=UPI0005CADEF8|nr:SagB family peptide dehydrogenase [Azospirillum sp. B4]